MSGKRSYCAILSATAYTEVLIPASSAEEAIAKAEELKYRVTYELFDQIVEAVFMDDLGSSLQRCDGSLEISHPEMSVDSGGVEGGVAQQLRN